MHLPALFWAGKPLLPGLWPRRQRQAGHPHSEERAQHPRNGPANLNRETSGKWGSHVLDEEDSATPVHSVRPAAGQVQPVDVFGHRQRPQGGTGPRRSLGSTRQAGGVSLPHPPVCSSRRGGHGGKGDAEGSQSPPIASLRAPAGSRGSAGGSWTDALRAAGNGHSLTPAGPGRAPRNPGRHLLPAAGVCAPLRTSPQLNDGQLAL